MSTLKTNDFCMSNKNGFILHKSKPIILSLILSILYYKYLIINNICRGSGIRTRDLTHPKRVR